MKAIITGKKPKIGSMPKMNFSMRTGFIVQAAGIISVVAAQMLHTVPPEYVGILTSIISLCQAVAGLAAHYSNPDGTPAAEAWTPPAATPASTDRALHPADKE